MKGVDAAVATILLLMITISLIGFAFVWFNRLAKQSAQTIENQTLESQKKAAMRIKILAASSSAGEVTVQNIGSETIPAGGVVVFVNGAYQNQTTSQLAPNGIATMGISCNAGDEVKATAPGNEDYITCD